MNRISTSPTSVPYWGLLKNLSNKDKLELISLLSSSMVNDEDETNDTEEVTGSGWADRFCGAWKDSRSADEIVDEIRSMRTANNFDTEL
jgi:hypothetical protein